jgi:hypothetical protein
MDSDAQTTASSAQTAAWSYDVESSIYTDLVKACLNSKFHETHQIEFERPIYPSTNVAKFSLLVYRRRDDDVFQPEEWPVCDLSNNLTDEEKASSKDNQPEFDALLLRDRKSTKGVYQVSAQMIAAILRDEGTDTDTGHLTFYADGGTCLDLEDAPREVRPKDDPTHRTVIATVSLSVGGESTPYVRSGATG